MSRRALLAVLLLAAPAAAGVLKVPADFPTIQAAVDAALPGDVVRVSAGSYAETVLIQGHSQLELRGAGKVVVDGVRVWDSSAVVVRHLRVAAVQDAALWLLDSSGCRLERCRVESAPAAGVQVESCSDVQVVRCRIRGTQGPGVYAHDVAGLLLERNTVRDAPTFGVVLFDQGAGPVSDALVSRNRLRDCGQVGLSVQAAGAGVVVERNRITDTQAIGMILGDGAVQALDNVVRRAGSVGLFVLGDGAVVRGNLVRKPGTDGLRIEAAGGLYEDNVVRHAGQSGFAVEGTGNHFDGNVTTDSAAYGLDAVAGNTFGENDFDSVSPGEG